MGWGKIKKKLHKIADPLKITDRIDKLKIVKNIKSEGTKGVAKYGAAAGTVAQFIPVVGTAVGAGLIAGSVAANIKLKQDEAKKQQKENDRLQAAWASEDAAAIAAASPTAPENTVFTPTTPTSATTIAPLGGGGGYGGTYNNFSHDAGNILNNLWPADSDHRAMMSGAAPGPSQFAPGSTNREVMTGSAEPHQSFVASHKTGLLIAGGVVLLAVGLIIALKR